MRTPAGSRRLDRQSYSIHDRQHVVLGHDEVFLAVVCDLVAGVGREQHPVADLHLEWGALAVVQRLAFADREDLALLRLLLGGVGQDDAAGRLVVGLEALDQILSFSGTIFIGVVSWVSWSKVLYPQSGIPARSANRIIAIHTGWSGVGGGGDVAPYAFASARSSVLSTMFMFTGFGITLNTWAWNAWRIRSLVASAVMSTAGSMRSSVCRMTANASSPVSRGMCMSNRRGERDPPARVRPPARRRRPGASGTPAVQASSPSASRVPRSSSAIRTEKRCVRSVFVLSPNGGRASVTMPHTPVAGEMASSPDHAEVSFRCGLQTKCRTIPES